jgi:hypothetical protein
MADSDDFVEDPQAPDEENARRFFGFSPGEDFDAFTLRARRLKREDQAATPRQRERVQRYFAILAHSAGIPIPPPRPSPPAEPPPDRGLDVPLPEVKAYTPPAPVQMQATLRMLRSQLDYALHTEVINHTITAYHQLFATLVNLARLLGVEPDKIGNAWVRSHMKPAAPDSVSRAQLEEVLELLPEGLHVSLGGTPEFNHPSHRYIANAPESRLGLQFEYILDAIRAKASELLANPPAERWYVS